MSVEFAAAICFIANAYSVAGDNLSQSLKHILSPEWPGGKSIDIGICCRRRHNFFFIQ